MIGVSGAGKTTLSRFVAWMNGLSVFQIKVRVFKIEVLSIEPCARMLQNNLCYDCLIHTCNPP